MALFSFLFNLIFRSISSFMTIIFYGSIYKIQPRYVRISQQKETMCG